MSELVSIEDHGRVRHLILDRPEKRNAFNRDLVLALREAAREAADDHDVHCVVLRGEGAAFSAGHRHLRAGRPCRDGECCARSAATASRPPTCSRR